MSPPPAPSPLRAVSAVFKLQWRRLVRGKKLRLAAIAVVMVLLGPIATRYSSALIEPEDVMKGAVTYGFFMLLVYLVPFLFLSGAIAEEVEARTLPFLASRPVSRLALTLGKYLAGAVASVAVLGLGLVILHIGCYATEPSQMIGEIGTTAKVLGAITLLALCYSALCMCFGALVPEAAGIMSVLYLGTIELVVGLAPGVFRLVSMNYLASQLAGLEKGGMMATSVPDVPAAYAVAALAAVTLAFIGVAALIVRTSEFRFGNA